MPRQFNKNARKKPTRGAGKIRRVAHEPSVSHLRRPMGLEIKARQTQLRRQYGRSQSFRPFGAEAAAARAASGRATDRRTFASGCQSRPVA